MNGCIEMAKRLIVDSIWKSANLEGLGTTFPKTEAILENIPVDTSKEEVLFIINMKRAWDFLLNDVNYPNSFMYVRELNKVVLDKLVHGNGEVRKLPLSIGGTGWEPDIPDEATIYDKIHDIESIENCVDRALKYFCFIARSQMFIDGNKRVAQLMANKVLISNNIGMFQIPVEAIEAFKSLLLDFYETNDDSSIIDFMKRYCVRYTRGFLEEFKNQDTGNVENFEEVKIPDNFVLSEKQVAIFNSILKNIRNLLKSKGYSGEAILLEDSELLIFKMQESILIMTKQGKIQLNSFEGLKEDSLVLFVIKTIKLLENSIPFPIKKLYFNVSSRDLCFGDFVDSPEEVGSLNIRLY